MILSTTKLLLSPVLSPPAVLSPPVGVSPVAGSCAKAALMAKHAITTSPANFMFRTLFISIKNLKLIVILSFLKHFVFQLFGQLHFAFVEDDVLNIILHKFQWR